MADSIHPLSFPVKKGIEEDLKLSQMRGDTLQHTATHCNTLQHTAPRIEEDLTLSQMRAEHAELRVELAATRKARTMTVERDRERERERILERDSTQQYEARQLQDQATISLLNDELVTVKNDQALSERREMQRDIERDWGRELQENELSRAEAQLVSLRTNLASLEKEHMQCPTTTASLEEQRNNLVRGKTKGLETNTALERQIRHKNEELATAQRIMADSQSVVAAGQSANTSSLERVSILQAQLDDKNETLTQAEIIIGRDRKLHHGS